MAKHFGTQKRRSPHPPAPISQVLDRIRAAETGPSTHCARLEDHTRLLAALGQLESAQREALVLRFFQERTLIEIAERLGCSEVTVRRHLARGGVKLGEQLAKRGGGE